MRTLSKIKQDYINCWCFNPQTDTFTMNERRQKLNAEFVKAMADGVPWEEPETKIERPEIIWRT
jgi:hypothetical protein